MTYNTDDIIIALATPPGVGAMGVIRLSGNGSIDIVDQFFKGKNLSKQKSHTAHLGKIINEKSQVLDEVIVTIFICPSSYTKEDVVEISCHGSQYIINEIISLFLRNGARMADRGEFTLRAFLNGQLDLSQAEAVADLIASENEASHKMAMKQMRGGFSNEIIHLRQELIDFCALIELELDFGEEDVEFADRTDLKNLISKLMQHIQTLIDSFQLGNVLKNGVATVIAGIPNSGKSTLLNALLNEERAIVSSIAGTTRDTIEEILNINGIQFRFIDTAGLRSTHDEIESIGISKTKEKIEQAPVIIYMFDVIETSPTSLQKDLQEFLINQDLTKIIFVANKMDKNPYTQPQDYYIDNIITKENLIPMSAKSNMNVEYLKEKLFSLVVNDSILLDKTIVNNIRHYEALYKAQESLQDAFNGLNNNITGDFIAMDLRRAQHYLGMIVGQISSEDLLDSVFSRFCIGK